MEHPDGRFGTFELSLNAFREKCGIIINHDGKIELDLGSVVGAKANDRQKYKKKYDGGCGTATHTEP